MLRNTQKDRFSDFETELAEGSYSSHETSFKKVFVLTFGVLLILSIGIFSIFLWTWYGKLEESVPGTGQFIPDGQLKRIMSPINGIVSHVYVKENDEVKEDTDLIKLDTEYSTIEENGILEQLNMLKSEADAIRDAYLNKQRKLTNNINDAWLYATHQAFKTQMKIAKMQISKVSYQHKQAKEKLSRSQIVYNSSYRLFSQYKALYEQGGLSEKEYRLSEQDILKQQGEIASLKQDVKAREIELEQAKQRPKEIKGRYQKELLNQLAIREKEISKLENEIEKNNLTTKRLTIKSPIEGIVNQQVVRGPGETVSTGEVLFTLVPANTGIIAEIKVTNRDLTYIHTNQRVMLRMDAFPFQHFEKLYGVVENISPSSIQDPQGLNYYIVRVRPDNHQILEDTGELHNIKPGMTVTADFVTRKKSIISFLSDPIQFHMERAFKEPTTR